ncbi:MAG: nucleotide exchange factor GrpE [Bacteroidia bacterium]|nr:nucleotide exchange factor GrpE [Bacteroidia bacterium]
MIDEQNNIHETENLNELDNTDKSIENADSLNEEVQENTLSEVEALKQQLHEANDKFLRLYAEFDNYKRRTMKEKTEILQTASKEVMLSLLPVIDDFERAQKAANSSLDLEAYKQGIELIHHKFNNILSTRGLKALESVGQEFNVDLHEAITNIPASSDDLKGKVIDETEKGYMLNGHVIRFAKVVVGE